MVFCSSNTETITETNYNTPYNPASSCLPNSGTGFAISDFVTGTQNITPSTLSTHVVKLLANKNAIAPATISPNSLDPAAAFTTAAAGLRSSIQTEYCYYHVRYMWALNDVLTKALTVNPSDPMYINQKTNTTNLNSKLNQILQILQELTNSRSMSLNSYYGRDTGVNQLNSTLEATRTSLVTHSDQLKSASMEVDVQSAMIDYTIEKNSSSRNLLAVYGFMNIVAVGLLFYLYRTSKN